MADVGVSPSVYCWMNGEGQSLSVVAQACDPDGTREAGVEGSASVKTAWAT